MTLEKIIIVLDTLIKILSFCYYNFNNDSGHGLVLIDQKRKDYRINELNILNACDWKSRKLIEKYLTSQRVAYLRILFNKASWV